MALRTRITIFVLYFIEFSIQLFLIEKGKLLCSFIIICFCKNDLLEVFTQYSAIVTTSWLQVIGFRHLASHLKNIMLKVTKPTFFNIAEHVAFNNFKKKLNTRRNQP